MAVYETDEIRALHDTYCELYKFIKENTEFGKIPMMRWEEQQAYDFETHKFLIGMHRFTDAATINRFENSNRDLRELFGHWKYDPNSNPLLHKPIMKTFAKFASKPEVREDFKAILKKFNELAIPDMLEKLFDNPPEDYRKYVYRIYDLKPEHKL